MTTVHLFAGGFGDGRGYLQAGYQPVYAANHLQVAVDTARANCPRIWAQRCDINNLDMRTVPKADGVVGSPICTEVSPAAGMPMPKPQTELPTGCPECGPVLGLPEKTGRNANHKYACPTRRCGHRRVTPALTGIGTAIDWDTHGTPFGAGQQNGTGRPYVQATRRRVEIGLQRYGGEPFIITLRNHGTASPMSSPIGTITAQGGVHHGLVRPTTSGRVDDCEYRPLTVAENARAQGFPDHHLFAGAEDDHKLQIGNAVPVNVARWQAERITAAAERAEGAAA